MKQIAKFRKGKDLGVEWTIKAKTETGEAYYPLSENTTLLLVTPFGKTKVESYTINGNTVSWIYRGRDQKHDGLYGLELIENLNEVGMVTIDTCEAFELVDHTCEETGQNGDGLIFNTLKFITDVELTRLQGPEGPQGPQGPQGEPGPQGPKGDSGEYDDSEIKNKLTELSAEVSEINKKIDNLPQGASMIPILYADLVSLRDNGGLVAGSYYRITDYITTTAQENTQSAGHPFDVIVLGLSENTLAEEAYAIQREFNIDDYKDAYSGSWDAQMVYLGTYEHEGKVYHHYGTESQDMQMLVDFDNLNSSGVQKNDHKYAFYPSYTRLASDGDWYEGEGEGESINFKTYPNYFDNSNLDAWKLWYSLDNDAERFAWADTENGKGVIYRMIDEWNNDIPYDFKNIQFKRFAVTEYEKSPALVVDNEENYYGYYYGALTLYGEQAIREATYGEDFVWVYTFALKDLATDTWHDYSVLNAIGLRTDESVVITCHSNVIKEHRDEYLGDYGRKAAWLNNIVFLNCYTDITSPDYADEYSYCNSNSFVDGCNSNSFGNGCYSNSFGNDCNSNSFGNDCGSNSFGNGCYSNSFGNGCGSNSFGNGCNSNSFGNGCGYNSFGNGCGYNSFGNGCGSNSFVDGCGYNSFGNGCYSNSFGNGCYSNSFGNDCYYNSFGNGCYSNSFVDEDGLMNQLEKSRIDDGVNNVRFFFDGDSNAVRIKNNHFCRGIEDRIVEIMVTDNEYEEIYSMTSDGELRYYCIADVV